MAWIFTRRSLYICSATVTNLQGKVESLTTTNALMKEDLAIARNSLLSLQAENAALRQGKNSSSSGEGRSGDHDMDRSLAEERRRRLEAEKEMSLQVSLKAESDMAMKLLEKDIHEKQDTIISLRRQLDDIKQINLEMYKKLQVWHIRVRGGLLFIHYELIGFAWFLTALEVILTNPELAHELRNARAS